MFKTFAILSLLINSLSSFANAAGSDVRSILDQWSGTYPGIGDTAVENEGRNSTDEQKILISSKGIEVQIAQKNCSVKTEKYPISDLSLIDDEMKQALNKNTIGIKKGNFKKDRAELWFLLGPKSTSDNSLTLAILVEGLGILQRSIYFTNNQVQKKYLNEKLPQVVIENKFCQKN